MGATHAADRRKLVIAAIAAAALLALSALLPLAEWARQFEDSLDDRDLLAAIAIFTAVYAVATMLFAPGWIFPVVAGAAFGIAWGLVIAIAASVVSSTAAFLTSRYVLRDAVQRRADKHRLFKQLDRAVAKDGWRVVALMRLTPVLPFAVKNYFLGLTRIRLLPYAAATAAGMLPGLMLKVYLGAVGRAALGMRDPLQWLSLAIGLAASAALMLWLARFARGRLRLAFPKLP
jgi:uncharacterized membrane protein YdjX (TVP38/TMEM64 family)